MENKKFYTLPLKLENCFQVRKGTLHRCTEKESIDQNIEMLITTCPGEHHFDEHYGCYVWDMDFECVMSVDKWQQAFISHIENSIARYEPRLKDVSVAVVMHDIVQEDLMLAAVSIRKCVDIYVTAQLCSNEEYSKFGYIIYLGPLSK